MGDVEDFPDMRVDAASPGPRVTFNIQDTVKYIYIHCVLYATPFLFQKWHYIFLTMVVGATTSSHLPFPSVSVISV